MALNGTIENYKELDLKNIVKADWNYKEDDEEMMSKLVANIKEYGQVENIIVRQLGKNKYECVNGNHRVDAFNTLGFKKVVAYDMGKVSLQKAQLVCLLTNETKFVSNDVKLHEILKNISLDASLGEIQKMLPWDEDLIQDKINSVNFDFSNFNTEGSEVESSSNGESPFFNLKMDKDVWQKLEPELKRIMEVVHGLKLSEDVDNGALMYSTPLQILANYLSKMKDKQLSLALKS